MGCAHLAFFGCEMQGFSKTDDVGHILSPCPQAVFLPPTRHVWEEFGPFADVERANAFRPVEFVPAKRHQVDAEGLGVHIQISRSLHGIGVKKNIIHLRNARQFSDGVDRADLIVRVHDRDECRVTANSFQQRLWRNAAKFIHIQPFEGKSVFFFKLFGGFANGMVFGF